MNSMASGGSGWKKCKKWNERRKRKYDGKM
jgi:hypothetical protein